MILTDLNDLLNRLEANQEYWREVYIREVDRRTNELEKARHESAAYKKAWEEAQGDLVWWFAACLFCNVLWLFAALCAIVEVCR